MGRWTQHDEDSSRLPEGMVRIGYDSDTQRYYFRDRGGSVWQGTEGAQYSEMTPVSSDASSYPPDEDLEAAPRRADGYQPLATDANARYMHSTAGAYRTLFPFFLLIGIFLLLVWRLVLSPGLAAPKPACPDGSARYLVEPGDTCWEIARVHGCSLDDLKKLNDKVECERLMPGMTVCLPNASNPPDVTRK
ncbi:hypothetical protein GGX14DRAFT_618800 [Mycena pura]|uniref:LysM domain-containing protein n=1 Tax=Mycena pura TaxID=153505 RepID=A0AAD6YIX2_9AGAR|nr:hypothetical protein GGX14DRAFT_618800 [Mycena pura]